MRLGWVVAVGLLAMPVAAPARIADDTIRIGVLGTDNVVAAQLAASDFERLHLRANAEVIAGDADLSMQAMRHWLDIEHVDAVLSLAGPVVDRQVAAAMAPLHRTLLAVETGGSPDEAACLPDTIVWGAGPVARARALVHALPADKSWLVLSDQGPVGVAEQAAVQHAVTAAGGVFAGAITGVDRADDLGKVEQPIVAAKPDVVVLTQGDGNLVDVVRATGLAALPLPVTFAAPAASLADIDQIGPAAAGLVVVSPFYWDANDRSRRFAARWDERAPWSHAGDAAALVYAATSSFLTAALAVNDTDADKVGAELRRAPIRDTLFGTVTVRADGRVLQDVTVYRVKPEAAIEGRWAYYDKVATVPADVAFPPAGCASH
jgi:branched-chain amino acid transport system substrate-binding protein